jgi:2-keto-4-pentenoate hydratase/2-oxohepta-3-ene-1,7-dioic acid hydratase in catechol pathway
MMVSRGVDHLVWYLSQFMVLEPGDLINTGTPAGVGLGRVPERYLNDGDFLLVKEIAERAIGCAKHILAWLEEKPTMAA